jgi:uncharacterized membrane protein
MNSTAVVLVICAAVLHAGWNLLARRQRSEVIFFRRLLLALAVAGIVPFVAAEVMSPVLPAKAWVCAACSGTCFGLYFYALAHAYESSDFTVVYPLARSLPVLLIAVGDVARGHPLTGYGWLGIMLVVTGCLLAPLHSFWEFNPRQYLRAAGIWTGVVILATVAFTLFDKIAADAIFDRTAASAGGAVIGAPGAAWRYGYLLYAIASAVYLLLYHNFRGRKEDLAAVGWRLPLLGGALTYGGYFMMLWAFQLVARASYLVAFRQFSIVLGVLLAFAIYRERGFAVRTFATVLITAGLVVIAVLGK